MFKAQLVVDHRSTMGPAWVQVSSVENTMEQDQGPWGEGRDICSWSTGQTSEKFDEN